MQKLLHAPLVCFLVLAAVLLFPPALATAQDATAPTANYMPPPGMPNSNAMPATAHTLGTLSKSEMAATPMPSATPTAAMPMPATVDDVLQPKQMGNITYVTGGVGEEERNTLESTKKNYNLHVMVADKTGHFVADTQIIIRDPKGDEILNATAGPIFYVKLPAGSYMVEAINEGQSKKQNVTIHGNEAAHVHFSW